MVGGDQTDVVQAGYSPRDSLGMGSFLRGQQSPQGEGGHECIGLFGLVQDGEVRTRAQEGVATRHGHRGDELGTEQATQLGNGKTELVAVFFLALGTFGTGLG